MHKKYESKILCLNSLYSTTRRLTKAQPNPEKNLDSVFEVNLFLPKNNTRKGEGGLRTKGYFKQSLPDHPVISIITVVFNGQDFLEETIKSVVGQTYDNVEYIIIDGGSTDSTLEIIKAYEDNLDYWVSEYDGGMYEAIHKGFKLSSGSILGWLNSDDKYYPHTLSVVSKVFSDQRIKWITGVPSVINSNGEMIYVKAPQSYFRWFISKGYYRDDYLGFIQQESTFFRKDLYAKHPLNFNLKMAGDYQLWIDFSKSEPLYTVPTILGSFRVHPRQKSAQIDNYYRECDEISKSKKLKIVRYILKLLSISKIMRNNLILPTKRETDHEITY